MKRLRFPIIGLTGNIGSGKSTVARRFSQLGAHVLDADAMSRALLEPDGACYQETVRAFGKRILADDGRIDRKALGNIVFADAAQREKLNGIVHPRVIDGMLSAARAHLDANPDTLVVLDVPLLYESGMDRMVDYVVFVSCNDETRLQRILLRDGRGREDAMRRMRAQGDQAAKRDLADAVIDNDGSLDALFAQTDAVYAMLMEERA